MYFLTLGCALVAVVACVGVVWLSISLANWRVSMSQQLAELRLKIERHSNAELRAEVDALAAAATKHAASVRKQFGSVWAEFQRFEQPDEPLFDEDQPELPGAGAPPACSCGWCQACKARANGEMVRP